MISNQQQNYYFGKGRVGLFEIGIGGGTSKGLYTGNAPDFKITMNVDKKEHFESMSGTNQKDREIITQLGADISLTIENLSAEMLALLTWGQVITIASATGQTYQFPIGITAGETYLIPSGFNLTSVVITDSAGTPATLVEGTDYEIDATFGTIRFLNVTGRTQPLRANYNRGAAKNVPFFGGVRPNRFIVFDGINIGNPGASNQKVRVEIYNCVFEPVSDLSLIGDDFGKFELKGSALRDDFRATDANFGSFGRLLYL